MSTTAFVESIHSMPLPHQAKETSVIHSGPSYHRFPVEPNPGVLYWAEASRPFVAAGRRAGEVEAQLLLLGEADEVPLVSERPLVTAPKDVQHDAPGLAHAVGVLEQIN